jgi:nucleoid DNA-binding protein
LKRKRRTVKKPVNLVASEIQEDEDHIQPTFRPKVTMTMVIENLWENSDLTKKQAHDAVWTIIKCYEQAFIAGQSIRFGTLGIFNVPVRKPRRVWAPIPRKGTTNHEFIALPLPRPHFHVSITFMRRLREIFLASSETKDITSHENKPAKVVEPPKSDCFYIEGDE